MNNIKLGFAMCGSFCTLKRAIAQLESLAAEGYDILPIMSENVYSTDTYFGKASDFIRQVESITGKEVIHTISQAEPIGPKKLIDCLVIAPCTGNTLAKLANGVTDTSVTMAAKAQLRNGRPVVIALASNDALGANAKNFGMLINTKNVYFVPLNQDDPVKKPQSLVADMTQISETVKAAISGRQIQPIFRPTA
mgnify:FL=1